MYDMIERQSSSALRAQTPALHNATDVADRFRGLPPGISRWRLAAALRAAARSMGLTHAMLRLLEHYIDLTYDIDWEADCEPIVTVPLIETAAHLGRSERQIRNIERMLVERGLMTWRDSGNYHRKGRRDRRTGRLIYAYGPSLAPLGERAVEIIARAEESRRQTVEARRLRIAISALHNRIRASLAAPDADNSAVATIRRSYNDLPTRLNAQATLETLQKHRDALKTIADTLWTIAHLTETTGEKQKISYKVEKNIRHITDTTSDNAINGCTKATTTQKENDFKRQERQPVEISPQRLIEISGPMFNEASKRNRSEEWDGIVQTAQEIAPWCGIDAKSWRRAVTVLGHKQAAISIILIEHGLQRHSADKHPPIRNPQGYLDSLIKRQEGGRLRLDASIRALQQRSNQNGEMKSRNEGACASLSERTAPAGSMPQSIDRVGSSNRTEPSLAAS
jgi:replication initiation protein RepC